MVAGLRYRQHIAFNAATAVRVPSGAVHDGAGIDWFCHCAGAVGDCQGGSLKTSPSVHCSFLNMACSHSVSLAVGDDRGGSRAVSGICSEDLSGVADVGIVSPCIRTSHEGGGGDDSDRTHFDGWTSFVDSWD